MDGMFLNIGLGFLEGLALIVSPCILPILPIILAGSLEGGKKRPIGIVIGFVLTFALFTFFSRQLVQFSGIDLTYIRYISYALLILLGIVMLSTSLSEKFTLATQRLANIGSSFSYGNNSQGGLLSGIVFGGLVGLIWTPCAGPILAAVIVQSVLQQTSLASFFVVLAFGIGAAIPMLIIAVFGRSMMAAFSIFRTHALLFRKLLGVIIIASVVYMIYGFETIATSAPAESESIYNNKLINGLMLPYQAPEISDISAWINSPPLTIKQLKGKVVLLDFWAYSCINCIRTFPYLKDWYNKYHDKGFEIIGVQTPEFEFEKNVDNVKAAVKKYGINYPVALDNHYATWENYNNQYWPAHYLIDKNGTVVYIHFGEGEYAVTENNIRFLLGLNAIKAPATVSTDEYDRVQTPETYLGYARMRNYASLETVKFKIAAQYTFPEELSENQWALQGSWKVTEQNSLSMAANAALKIHFVARKVFIVMGNSTGFPITVKLLLNGEPVIKNKGKDVVNSAITVTGHGLYEAIVLPQSASSILELIASAPGLEVYTFTFGSG